MADPKGTLTLEEPPEQPVVETVEEPAPRWTSRARAHLAQPFYRNAYALMLNTGLTGALGLVYWFLAAQNYSADDVGRGSTAISVMTLLSGLVALNVSGTLNRFLPQSGRSVRRVVTYAYLLTCAAVVLLTLGFFATLDLWGPSFDLFRDPTFRTWFLVAVVGAGVFTAQDGVLTGLRSAVWVPVENAVFGVAKIVLLVVLARTFPAEGVFLSWVVPMVVILLPTNALIYGRLLPRRLRAEGDRAPAHAPAAVWRFFAADYVGAVVMFATVHVVPVLVADRVPPATYAYFFVAWVIGSMLNLVAVNLATSLSVEGVYERATLAANCRAALLRALALMILAAVVLGLGAYYLLGFFGGAYLEAVPLLQLLALAALPRAVTEIYVGVLRAEGRAPHIVRLQVLRGLLILGSVVFCLYQGWVSATLGVSRVTAVGVALLASQSFVALLVLRPLWTFLRDDPARPSPAERAAAAAAAELPGIPAERETVPTGTVSSPADDGAGRPARRRRLDAVAVGIAALTAVAGAGFLVSLRGVDLDAMTGLGLVSVLSPISLGAVALLTLAFGWALSLRRPRPLLMSGQLVVLVVLLHGVTVFLEAMARFPISWVHAGFVEYIARTGTVAPGMDARFSWPGFFALVSFLTGSEQQDVVPTVLKVTPVVSNLLYLLPLWLILRNVRATWQARWLAMWLFVVLNWVGQDYFSPQGFTYLLYLLFVAVLVTWFRPSCPTSVAARGSERFAGLRRAWRRFFPPAVPGESPPGPTGEREQTVLLLLLVGLFVAATVSHQLTPFLMLFAAAGLVFLRRSVAKGLPVLLGVLLVAWLSYMTVAYWSGHLGGLLSGIGDLTGNLSSSVAGRAQGGDAQHQLVVFSRIGITLVVFALAGLGLLRRRRRGLEDRVLFVLLVMPLSAVLLQDYGGEIMLRVYFFSLPAACCLVAFAFFPKAGGRPRLLSRICAVVCALALAGAFFVARYGNESYERIRPGEVAAVEVVHEQTGAGGIVVFLNGTGNRGSTPFMPLGYRDVEKVRWEGLLAPRNPDDVSALVAELRSRGPGTLLLTTRGQEANLVIGDGYPAGWGEEFRRSMAAAPGIRVVTANDDAVVYAVSGPRGPGSPSPAADQTGYRIGTTPWTPVGLVFLVLLVAVLVWREVWRLRLPMGEARRLRPLTFAAAALLLGLGLVVLERLVLLGP
ncbi:MAG TPA: hypothetical protein VHF92_07275 [Geodermatophilus sp.]|nr:hypothetical protein [Geodermatophilus sp.]